VARDTSEGAQLPTVDLETETHSGATTDPNDSVLYHSRLGLTSMPGPGFWWLAGVKGISRQLSPVSLVPTKFRLTEQYTRGSGDYASRWITRAPYQICCTGPSSRYGNAIQVSLDGRAGEGVNVSRRTGHDISYRYRPHSRQLCQLRFRWKILGMCNTPR